MEIRESSLSFPEVEGEGPQTASLQLSFPRTVTTVAASISGYTALFEDREDHHVGRLEIEVNAAVNDDDDTLVDVTGRFGLRDWSNEWDDPYSGVVDISVLAELVPVPTPVPGAPRGDLLVVGAEITQVIQHFRSAEHLDAANVFPDNSVRLVADKPTIVRLYVDYDASSGLPPIAWLGGQLAVESGGSTTTLSPLQLIRPRRDISTQRGNRAHTLNFKLPEAVCRGQVTLRATVSNAFDSSQFAAPFEREVQFDTQPALDVMAVGITYTGPDVKDDATEATLAAPVESDFVDTLALTDTLYPIPEVRITSYVEMEYDGETNSDINEGCDKMDDLRDAVSELRGDSDDIALGLYNVGVETGSVGGCGGSGTGVGRVGRVDTAAHEIGHALGRKHAPCDNVTRCAQPKNTDDQYPRYSGYDSDSIGEFGVDPGSAFGNVVSPVTAHDVMGYSPNDWISPYTYKALMSAIPGSDSGASAELAAAAAPAREGEWIPVKQPKLFLRLTVDRDGHAELEPSFHFDARPRPTGTVPTDYSVEFLGPERELLSSTCLFADDAGCGCCRDGESAVRFRQAVAFPVRSRWMLLVRCGETVADWPVPDPPRVSVECDHESDDEHVIVRWKIGGKGAARRKRDDGEPGETEYWALVQWRDGSGNWRGCAPRTTNRELVIPRWVFGASREVTIRVLVTSGIATGVAECTGVCGAPPLPYAPEAPRIVLVGAGGEREELPAMLRAAVVGPVAGGGGRLRWFAEGGGELARGRTLDLRALPVGQSLVSARVVGSADRVRGGSWIVERTADDRFFLRRGDLHAASGRTRRDDPREEPQDGVRHRSTTHTHDNDRER
jgi:hypothetical protein